MTIYVIDNSCELHFKTNLKHVMKMKCCCCAIFANILDVIFLCLVISEDLFTWTLFGSLLI